jgi:hypothetical protein
MKSKFFSSLVLRDSSTRIREDPLYPRKTSDCAFATKSRLGHHESNIPRDNILILRKKHPRQRRFTSNTSQGLCHDCTTGGCRPNFLHGTKPLAVDVPLESWGNKYIPDRTIEIFIVEVKLVHLLVPKQRVGNCFISPAFIAMPTDEVWAKGERT